MADNSGNKLGLSNRLSENVDSIGQLRQNLVRATLAKQTLEYEKSELKKRIDDLEREIKTDGQKVRRILCEKYLLSMNCSFYIYSLLMGPISTMTRNSMLPRMPFQTYEPVLSKSYSKSMKNGW